MVTFKENANKLSASKACQSVVLIASLTSASAFADKKVFDKTQDKH